MSEETVSASELLEEARRTTHAVRAIARFVMILGGYSVAAGIMFGLGFLFAPLFSEALSFFFAVGAILGGLGVAHALSAGFNELDLSNRPAAPQPVRSEATGDDFPQKDELGLYPGFCSCTRFERGFGPKSFRAGVEYCERCNRAIGQGK